jgi:hypothetical protein
VGMTSDWYLQMQWMHLWDIKRTTWRVRLYSPAKIIYLNWDKKKLSEYWVHTAGILKSQQRAWGKIQMDCS